ncbi:MAG: YfhO family protein [Verrucomicrobiota bacterium]
MTPVRNLEFWLTPRGFAGLAALLILAAFPQVLISGDTFFFRDYALFGYPLAHYDRICFWRGELPLWNPYNDCGMPYLAQWNTMVLYPLNLVYYVIPAEWGVGFFCLLHLWLAAVGMHACTRYLLTQVFGDGDADGFPVNLAASVSGVLFAFNGLSLNCLMWPNNIAALGWMPWVIHLTVRAWRDGGRIIPLAALLGGLQLLTGAPEFILFTWLIIGTLFGADLFSRKVTARTMLVRLTLAGGLAGGLAMAQLLPFLELLQHAQRGTNYGDTSWAMPGWGWANFLVPQFYLSPWNFGVMIQPGQYWTSSYYLGILTWLLAGIALLRLKGIHLRLLGLLIFTTLILALGDDGWLYPKLHRVFPALGFLRFPIKFVVPAMFALPLLAGIGTWALLKILPNERRKATNQMILMAGFLLTLIAVLTWFAMAFPWPDSHCLHNSIERGVILIIGLLLLWQLCRQSAWAVPCGLGLVVLVWADAMTHVPNQNPTVAPWVYTLDTPTEKYDRELTRLFGRMTTEFHSWESVRHDPVSDVTSKLLGYYGNLNLLDGTAKLNGTFSLHQREIYQLILAAHFTQSRLPDPLADFLSVASAPEPGKQYSFLVRTNWLPLITAGQAPVFLAASNASEKVFSDNQFDPRREIVLPLEAKGIITVTNATKATAKLITYTHHQIEFEVSAAQPALVAIAQSHYPAWHAWVDGRETRLWKANYAFQALEVPAGKHRVTLRYVDRAFLGGMVVSIVSLLILSIWYAKFSRRRIPGATT